MTINEPLLKYICKIHKVKMDIVQPLNQWGAISRCKKCEFESKNIFYDIKLNDEKERIIDLRKKSIFERTIFDYHYKIPDSWTEDLDRDKQRFGDWFFKWNNKRLKKLLDKIDLDTKDIEIKNWKPDKKRVKIRFSP